MPPVASLATMSVPPPSLAPNYSHSYFPKGFRRYPHDRECDPDELAFETGTYGLLFDLSDLTKCQFGQFEDGVTYEECLSNRNRMAAGLLQEDALIILIEANGVTYRVLSTDVSGDPTDPTNLNGRVLLWEAGRIVQHYEYTDVVAKTANGEKLEGVQVDLEIVVWPDAFALTVALGSEQPKRPNRGKHRRHHHHHHSHHHHRKVKEDHKGDRTEDRKKEHKENVLLKEVSVLISFKDWSAKKQFPSDLVKGSTESLTLSCKIDEDYRKACDEVNITSTTLQNWELPREYDERFLSVVATLPAKFERTFETGYTDIRDYDDYTVKLSNGNKSAVYYPFVILMKRPANITGMVPIVCRPDGTPTGIPIQLSKNWHDQSLGDYSYFFVLLPIPAESDVEYLIRTVYGFYYDIPSASAAQLSLVGYGMSSGRWDQLAIGCFGETLCMDPEMSIVPHTITDVRGLMLRNGIDGQKWSWTECGWGGDTLRVFPTQDTSSDEPLLISGLKVAYMSHGPCFTDIIHEGFYGTAKQVGFTVRIRTARTDDLSRTFLTMKYSFHDTVYLGETGYLHNSKNSKYATPAVALGNVSGVFADKELPGSEGFTAGDIVETDVPMVGEAPYWISFYKNERFEPSSLGPGTKHVILRTFEIATAAGETFSKPSLAFVCEKANEDGRMSVEVNIRPPQGITHFSAGDTVTIDVQWMTTPGVEDNYYGPNHLLTGFLQHHPMSWEIVMREIDLNYRQLLLTVEGGTVESTYAPARIRVDCSKKVVILHVKAGVGGSPVEFVGLEHPSYKFYQILEGDDEQEVEGYQIDYDAKNAEYKLTHTMTLGSSFHTSWQLKQV